MKKHISLPHFWSNFQIFLLVCLLGVSFVQAPVAQAVTTVLSAGDPGQNLQPGQLFTGGKSHQDQDATWLQRKFAHQILGSSAATSGIDPDRVPGSEANLNFFPADSVSEPPTGAGLSLFRDSSGAIFTDNYMANLCGAGATTATLGYWGVDLYKGLAAYSDPYMTTHWADNDAYYAGHTDTLYFSYVMYIATQVQPPSFGIPGETIWQAYPNAYASFNDVRDTLNWEASGHSPSYLNFFYTVASASSLTPATLNSDIMYDIYTAQEPPIISVVDGGYLPDWPVTSHTSHYVTILGYNDVTNTYTYAETCGSESCRTSGTGIYQIDQDTLYQAMENDNENGGIIW